MPKSKDKEFLSFGGEVIGRGERKEFSLSVPKLYDFTEVSIPVEVIRGRLSGPVLFISSTLHGDEIGGIDVIRRLIKKITISKLRGTLVLTPIVNVFGFNQRSRYLPDRRDLNRCFPGSPNGSLASQLANLFMKEIVNKCTHGIDMHTGAIHRNNLPQIRACLEDPATKKLAQSFGVPVIINSDLRDGSLREAARKKKIPMLLFEGGEALRFDEKTTKIGVDGCLSVMQSIGMLEGNPAHKKENVFVAKGSQWVRAPHSGIVQMRKKLGRHVVEGDILAKISDPFGKAIINVTAPVSGIIVGMSRIPLANRGDALFHIATFSNTKRVSMVLDSMDYEFPL